MTCQSRNRALVRARQEKDHPVMIRMLLQHVRPSISRSDRRSSYHLGQSNKIYVYAFVCLNPPPPTTMDSLLVSMKAIWTKAPPVNRRLKGVALTMKTTENGATITRMIARGATDHPRREHVQQYPSVIYTRVKQVAFCT